MMDKQKIYPRSKDRETVYLKNVVTDPSVIVGDYTMYNDFVNDPVDFQKNSYLSRAAEKTQERQQCGPDGGDQRHHQRVCPGG